MPEPKTAPANTISSSYYLLPQTQPQGLGLGDVLDIIVRHSSAQRLAGMDVN